MTNRWRNILNFALYQSGWFCALYFAGKQQLFLAWLIPAALSLIHLGLCERWKHESLTLLVAGAFGLLSDGLFNSLGWIEYQAHNHPVLPPVWIVVLWIQFATLFRFCLKWLRSIKLAVVCGALGGPLAYFAGQSFGAATLKSLWVYVGLALVWAVAVPILIRFAWRNSVAEGGYSFKWASK